MFGNIYPFLSDTMSITAFISHIRNGINYLLYARQQFIDTLVHPSIGVHNGVSHELNIGAGTLARPIEELLATMMHEMVHYYCHVHGIKDVSRGCMYHNRSYQKAAEAHALIVERHPKYGWSITKASDELVAFAAEHKLLDISITRNEFQWLRIPGLTGTSDKAIIKSKSSSRKYICPCCGNSVRATKLVNIACMDCDEEMICKY